ncbi:MAG: metal ABC transporter permease [Rubrimonas sp.]
MSAAEFVALDLPPLLIAMLAAMACALPGVFLLLRRQAMLGDAISHVVLPGVVTAFLLTGVVETIPMMVGAGAAALVAAALIEGLTRFGGVEPGAAMGVTFTTMFAAGVAALELSGAAGVHLDVEHALYGNLESLIWLEAEGWASLADPVALSALPPQLPRIAVVLAALAALTMAFWRPLALAAFDPVYAATVGARPRAIGAGLVAAAALAAVAAFEAVGSVLVIAMFVCPPAAARLCTDRLDLMLRLALGFAAVSGATGWLLAAWAPAALGATWSLGAAGMIAVVSGVILLGASLFGPARRRV